jgi:hypothetical protein
MPGWASESAVDVANLDLDAAEVVVDPDLVEVANRVDCDPAAAVRCHREVYHLTNPASESTSTRDRVRMPKSYWASGMPDHPEVAARVHRCQDKEAVHPKYWAVYELDVSAVPEAAGVPANRDPGKAEVHPRFPEADRANPDLASEAVHPEQLGDSDAVRRSLRVHPVHPVRLLLDRVL